MHSFFFRDLLFCELTVVRDRNEKGEVAFEGGAPSDEK
jgi:hypothetical protein